MTISIQYVFMMSVMEQARHGDPHVEADQHQQCLGTYTYTVRPRSLSSNGSHRGAKAQVKQPTTSATSAAATAAIAQRAIHGENIGTWTAFASIDSTTG